ncbi:MAG: UDP-N-acetyl-D-glucosamine dehydrogenase [Deltaproteobacteria bacterium RBG_13_61_14]|nr:MAG: UDP-N-acetyl-D-glucosamine dehydrogenase [Deltaproteobacteria bacterium RBG_13_61_14]
MADSSTTSRVRVAVIGCGYLGTFHAEKYAALPRAELVGVVDVVPERAAALAGRLHTEPFTDYRELLAQVQAVNIVVPTPEHYGVAKACLEAGLDILLEKPVTETEAQAEELVRLAQARSRIFQVGHLERFNPAILALRNTIVRPGFIEANRLGPFKERAANVDVILDLMIHDLDIILSFIKAPVKSVSALGVPVLSDKVDIANARLEFENGAVANLTASRVSLGEGIRKIRIFEPERYISIDYSNQKMAVFTLGEGDGADPMSRIRIQQVPLDRQDALQAELEAFLDSVAQRTPPAVSGEDGWRALKVALRIHECIAKNLPRPEAL